MLPNSLGGGQLPRRCGSGVGHSSCAAAARARCRYRWRRGRNDAAILIPFPPRRVLVPILLGCKVYTLTAHLFRMPPLLSPPTPHKFPFTAGRATACARRTGPYTADRVCAAARVCNQTAEYEVSAPVLDAGVGWNARGRACSAISPTCADGSYQQEGPTATSDRVCVACSTTCAPGEYSPSHLFPESGACSGTRDMERLECTRTKVDVVFARVSI